ncbi:MAG: DNRLRE domain-containing protein [Rhodothermaceae bacterium]
MRNLFLLLLSIFIPLLISCKQQESINEPSEPQGKVPAKPSFYQLLPLVQEPTRGMHLVINDKSDDEEGFRIERKKKGGSYSHLTTLSANSKTFDDWNLEISTEYTYRIQAFNSQGSSEWSEKTKTSAGEEVGTIFIYPEADSYVKEANPTENKGTNNYLLVDGAYNDPGKQMIAYIKFSYKQHIPNYAIDIKKAELRMICQNEPIADTALTTVHTVEAAWNENSITWNNRPNISFVALSTGQYVYNNGKPVYFDVTSSPQRWLKGLSPNNGLALKAKNSKGTAVLYSKERSQLKPLLTIQYYW